MLTRTLMVTAALAAGLMLAAPAFAEKAEPKPVTATSEEDIGVIFRQCQDESTDDQPPGAFNACIKKGFANRLDEEKNRANELLEKNRELVKAAVAHALEDAADKALSDCNDKARADLQRCLLGVALMHNGTEAAKKAGEDLQAIFQALDLLGEGRGMQKPPKAEMATPSLPASKPEKAADAEVKLPPAAAPGTKSGMPAASNPDNQCVVIAYPNWTVTPPMPRDKPKPTVRKRPAPSGWNTRAHHNRACPYTK